MSLEIWQKPEIIAWSELLSNSYEKLLGHQLVENKGSAQARAKELFFAPFVVVSHGTEEDPILNYGNRIGLELWQMSWQDFTRTPSRLTAEPLERHERQEMLAMVANRGFIDNYRGVRITSQGKRFTIQRGIVWNLTDERDGYCGQAATFSRWSFIH